MVRKNKARNNGDRFAELNDAIGRSTPQLHALVSNNEDFISLLIKLQPDGTCLSVLKGYGTDGSPMVCFGGGYGVAGSLMAVEGTLAADKWRVDVPWKDRKR